jgi:hypothetical protein
MALTTVGAGIDLANSILKVAAPTITQEQKESLLDAYKDRIASLQTASDAVAKNPTSQSAGDAYGLLAGQLLNAGGFTAGGLAAITISVPLDTADQLLSALILLVLVLEQQQQSAK